MELSSNNIIIIILSIFVLTYAYNDYIKPIITNIIQGKSITQSITEGFSSQYSSLSSSSSLSNTVQFDTNTYLRDANKPIIINNQISLPVITYANLSGNGSYDELIGSYFRKHIYPIQQVNTLSNIDTLYKFINHEVDIAFISEEILSRYIKRDCKYLTRILADAFNIDYTNPTNPTNPDTLDRLYPELNISAIGVGFHIDFYLIVNNFSNIVEFLDITKGKQIGVIADSYYYFVKICSAYGLAPNILSSFSTIEPNLETLNKKFIQDKYDGIFIAVHPKNKQLIQLSLDKKLRYIHIQKRAKLYSRNNLSNLTKGQQGTNNTNAIPPPPSLNAQSLHFIFVSMLV